VPAPGLAVERAHVIPNGEPLEDPVALSGEQHAAREGIKLDSADGAPSQEDASQDSTACPCK